MRFLKEDGNTACTDYRINRLSGQPIPNGYSQDRPFYARVIGNERRTADDHWQDVKLITFDVKGSNIRFVNIFISTVDSSSCQLSFEQGC